MTATQKTRAKRRYARERNGKASTATAATAHQTPAPPRETKISKVIAMLQREEGATLDEMVQSTGWQPHTARAALTGLKKKGHVIEREKRDAVTFYRITEAA